MDLIHNIATSTTQLRDMQLHNQCSNTAQQCNNMSTVYSLPSTLYRYQSTVTIRSGQVWSGLVWSSLVLKSNMQFDSTVRLNLLKARLSQSTSYSGSTFMFLFVSQPAISQSVQHPFFDYFESEIKIYCQGTLACSPER